MGLIHLVDLITVLERLRETYWDKKNPVKTTTSCVLAEMYLRIGDISWVPGPFGDSAHAYFKDFIGAKIAASIVLA